MTFTTTLAAAFKIQGVMAFCQETDNYDLHLERGSMALVTGASDDVVGLTVMNYLEWERCGRATREVAGKKQFYARNEQISFDYFGRVEIDIYPSMGFKPEEGKRVCFLFEKRGPLAATRQEALESYTTTLSDAVSSTLSISFHASSRINALHSKNALWGVNPEGAKRRDGVLTLQFSDHVAYERSGRDSTACVEKNCFARDEQITLDATGCAEIELFPTIDCVPEQGERMVFCFERREPLSRADLLQAND